MDKSARKQLVQNMVHNLPILRKQLNISQNDLADMVGVSRSTITNIESHRQKMTWNMFLSLILVFTKNKETDRLLNVMEIYTDELNDMVKLKINKL